jgi:potassium/hydrogen antiporter
MTNAILITISVLILVAYIFDISVARTKIPSIILLMLLGWLTGRFTEFSNIHIPDLNPALPVLGTIGLILIVLEGSLDLKLTRQKTPIILKSFFSALIAIILLSAGMALIISKTSGYPYIRSLINILPLSVISSSIAIPSVKHLYLPDKEFIVYESSFSDITGIIIFNTLIIQGISGNMITSFILQTLLMLLISLVVTILLFYLLTRIKHPIKFTPIIFSIILIYSISKSFYLPALILVFIFGLFLNNISHSRLTRVIKPFDESVIIREIDKFRDIVSEGSFIVRALFFLLFGFLIKNNELVSVTSLYWSLTVIVLTYLLRIFILKLFRVNIYPLLFVAPRGLISILLFLMIPDSILLPFIDKSVIIQVILITSLIMMTGLLTEKNPSDNTSDKS